MAAHFKLSYSGLNYLIASSEHNPDRDFLMSLVRNNNCGSASMDQLNEICCMDSKQSTKIAYKMLKSGWIINVDNPEDVKQHSNFHDISHLLGKLSSIGSVLLVDMRGLIVSSSGFSGINIHRLAASATNLIMVTEAAKKRENNLSGHAPSRIKFDWGEESVTVFRLCIGENEFILVVADIPQLNANAFFQMIYMLARRFSDERYRKQ